MKNGAFLDFDEQEVIQSVSSRDRLIAFFLASR
jgi:hypothetical protein